MRAVIDPALILAVLASGCANPAPKRRDLVKTAPDDTDAEAATHDLTEPETRAEPE